MRGSLVVVLLAALFLNGWFYVMQPAMTFYPGRELEATPARWGLACEEVGFTTTDWIPAFAE